MSLRLRHHSRGRGLGPGPAPRRDALLAGRREERVTLLVHREHTRTHDLYRTWGYETVGSVVPFDGAPDLHVMVRPFRDSDV